MRIVALEPSPAITRDVASYVIVDDRFGAMGHERVRTAPTPNAVLSVNFCHRSRDDRGRVHPQVGLLGLQSSARTWFAGASTLFLMVLLRPPGAIALLDGAGGSTRDELVDFASVFGAAEAATFVDVAERVVFGGEGSVPIDRWLTGLLDRRAPARTLRAYDHLRQTHRVDAAAAAMGVSARSLERWFRKSLGVGPKELLGLERLERSILAAQGIRTPTTAAGYADQAHEIRTWNRYVGQSPGRYRAQGPSVAGQRLNGALPSEARSVFYL